MRRRRGQDDDINTAGQDSFLDTLTNMVGVLIVLVMLVSLRAKNAPALMSIPGPERQAADRELKQALATQAALRHEVLETAAKIRQIELARRTRLVERSRLALMASAAEKMIDQRRKELEAGARAEYDRRRQLAASQAQLAELESQIELASRLPKETVRLESYPTPISRTVHGPELHLQLRGGRITVLPWDEILEALKTEFQRSLNRMHTQSELTSKIGPIGGFRINYTIRRHDVSMRTYEETGVGGSYVRLERFSILPVSTQLGETLEVALAPGSDFREALARCRPGRTTVTAWVYPDSFDQYRRLRKELYQMGFDTAGRPLPEGELIGGSPAGSRSAAQ